MRHVVAMLLLACVAPVSARAQAPALTLRDAIAEALRASPLLHAPDDERTLAQIRERQATARFGVKLNPQFQTGTDALGLMSRSIGVGVSKQLLSGGTVRFQADSIQFGEGTTEFRDAGYTVGISQPLFRGWKSVATAEVVQARRNIRAADTTRLDARQRLIVSVAETYFDVIKAQRLAAVAEQGLERARLLKVASEARSKVGLATELDVLRADLLAAQAEATVVMQREALETAQDALKTIIGRDADTALDVPSIDPAPIEPPPTEAVDAAIAVALTTRPDVREARDRISDARRQENVARWNLLPPVNLDIGYTRRGLGPGASFYGDMLNGWRFGFSSSYGLDRSDETAGAATAAVAVRAAEREARDVERKAADEIRRAYRARERTAATLMIQARAVDLAARQLRLAQLRYERGVAGNFDVVDAESNLLAAEAARISAEIDQSLAALHLRRVIGVLDPESFQP